MSNFSVTITGADNGVDPVKLDELGDMYPFVEWAILFSGSKEGQPRYPTVDWREQFYDVTCDREAAGYHTAAHLCGITATRRLQTMGLFETEIERHFDTVQFNLFSPDNYPFVVDYAKRYEATHQVIVPFNKGTANILTSKDPEYWRTLSVLCDSSGGRGIACKEWPSNIPSHFVERQAVGFAGGINEANIEAVLEGLVQLHEGKFFWIDLETGARDEKDRFDIDKVARILELASQFYDEFDIPGLDEDEFEEETGAEPYLQVPNLDEIIIR